jgi:hypothetical protein
MCPQIRELFVTILMFCQPANPRALYDEFWTSWVDDFEQQARRKGKLIFDSILNILHINVSFKERQWMESSLRPCYFWI